MHMLSGDDMTLLFGITLPGALFALGAATPGGSTPGPDYLGLPSFSASRATSSSSPETLPPSKPSTDSIYIDLGDLWHLLSHPALQPKSLAIPVRTSLMSSSWVATVV